MKRLVLACFDCLFLVSPALLERRKAGSLARAPSAIAYKAADEYKNQYFPYESRWSGHT